ncbi:hypothetical protein BJ508DRAFT_90259 [Ascobolus immersus RN42]|uniref:Uncharacterized protein n=1 Tax=Ascobolus immersus RN42 TaxID=1160509 RepID=A0A3N4IKW5_ASCIM|nr:hypothetical protein BJ508DRAFT_90259 [Ascobolus immersus RN42]
MPIQTPSPIVIDDNPPIFLIDSSSEDDTPLKPRRRRASTPLENAYTDKTVSHILIPDYSLTPPDFSEDDPPHFRTPPEYDRVPGLREVKGEKNDPALLCENGDGPKLSYGYVTRYDAKFGTPRGNARAKRRRDTVKREARREGWVKEEDGEAGEWESFRPEDLVDVDPAEVKGERRSKCLSGLQEVVANLGSE